MSRRSRVRARTTAWRRLRAAPTATRGRPGFTLTELMIALAVSVLLITALVATFVFHRRSYFVHASINDMNQNLRAAMDVVTREVRMAGYGYKPASGAASAWLDWAGRTMNSPLTIVQGATSNAPDQVLIAAAFGPPVSAVGSPGRPGDLTLAVTSGDGSKFNGQDRKLICIGGLEMARVISVSGDRLTISTDALRTDRGLQYNYPNGTPIELLQIISYSCAPDGTSGTYLFYRDEIGRNLTSRQKVLAYGLENFQVSGTSNSILLEMSSRTERPDRNYRHPLRGDGYRRASLRSSVLARNLR